MKTIIKVAFAVISGAVVLSLLSRKKTVVEPTKAHQPWRHKDTGKFVSSEYAWSYPWLVK